VDPILGFDRVGPYIVSLGTGGTVAAAGWSASRDEDGNWTTGNGVSVGAGTVPIPPFVPDLFDRHVEPAFEYGGFGFVLGRNFNVDEACTTVLGARRSELVIARKTASHTWVKQRLYCYHQTSPGTPPTDATIMAWAMLNTTLYVIVVDNTDDGGTLSLITWDFPTLLAAADLATVADTHRLEIELGTQLGYVGNYWLSTVGNRVYLGGGPFQQSIAGYQPEHGVYDVTDPTAPFCVHNGPGVGDTQTAISRGALPIPGLAAGEGFGTADPQFVGGF
jgi:hypothetical protein